jgi:ADP-heptose:LPS heptosyltransferase
VQAHRDVYEAICFEKFRWRSALAGVLGRLRRQRFDLALDLQRIVKSGGFCLAARADRKIGFDRRRCKEMTWLLPFERIPAADPGAHMLDQYMEFGRYLGLSPVPVQWDIPWFGPCRFDLPAEFAVLNVGATKPANRWFPDKFAGLADRLAENYDMQCVLTGGPADVEDGRAIVDAARYAPVDLTGRTSLPELITVLRRARVVVSCDTGPMHLAVALEREVVALFGPADPRRTGPYRGHVIRKKIDCMPCGRRQCMDRRCMAAIEPADVMAGFAEIFAGGRPDGVSPGRISVGLRNRRHAR